MERASRFASIALAGLLTALAAARPGQVGAFCVGPNGEIGPPNGVVEPGEACDDGNLDNGDCCLNDCTFPCADTQACTIDECRVTTGGHRCNHTWVADGQPCDGVADPDACTLERCYDRQCIPVQRSCEDQNGCTSDACDPSTGCVHQPTNENAPCNDGNPCTFQTRCQGGVCTGGLCDEGAPCAVGPCQATCRSQESGGCYCTP
jgi:hypothetical protein